MQLSNSDNLLHPSELESLGRLRAEEGPIFSVYLDLREGTQPLARYDQLLREAEQKRSLEQRSAEYRQQWAFEAQRIRRWLEREAVVNSTPQVKGVAVLSSGEAGLWRALLLPVPVMDRLEVGAKVHLRPLAILLAETPCALVALIEPGEARLVEVFLGHAMEVERLEAVPVTGDVGGDPFMRYVAERISAAWQHESFARLVIAGPPEARQALRETLPVELGELLVEDARLTSRAEDPEIIAEVRRIQIEDEQRIEAERAAELLARAEENAGAVLGMEQVLLAVRSKKIRMLVVEEDFHRSGGECPNCGFLGEEAQLPCLVCGMALRPESDLIEVALKRVLDQGGEIEVLRSHGSRRALARHGRIGALLNDLQNPPPTRSSSGAQVLSKGGKINPEAVYDEAVEESFPASDPPGNW